jgi:hypothetical protein
MKYQLTGILLAVVACGAASAFSCAHAQNQAAGQNIALGKKVTVEPRSNYEYTKNRDPQQLTDGIYASSKAEWDPVSRASSLWVQEGTMGWAHKNPIIITIDLETVQPISGVVYSTGAQEGNVNWPATIYIATSDDNQTWHYAGDLVQLSPKHPTLKHMEKANFRYIANNLKTKGRYVSLGVLGMPLVFTDEIEVLRGDDSLLNQSAGKEIPEMKEFVARQQITTAVQRRLNQDIAAIRALLKESKLSATQQQKFTARLDKATAATDDLPVQPKILNTTLPLNDLHREILAIHGEALAAQGVQPLTVWKQHRYAWLPFINKPEVKSAASLDFSMLKNQFRSDAVLLTNTGSTPVTAQVRVSNPPQGAQSGWLQLDSAIWTDTQEGTPVQDALMPMENKNGVYSFEIPAGFTGKLWTTIDTSKVPSGNYKSTLAVSNGAQQTSVPLNLNVSRIAMGTPRLSVAVWDYTSLKGMYGITPENHAAAIKLMQSHYVDSPWSVGWVLPTPKAADFDADHQLKTKLDFTNLDEWLNMWPGARNYCIFYNVARNDTFADAKMGTPQFDAKVGSWAKALTAHFVERGLKPSQLVLCPVDEAYRDIDDEHLVGWGKPIKATAPEITLFSDPIWRDPTQSKFPEAFTLPDILCPHPGWTPEFYQDIARKYNKELWLYNTPGMKRLGDPQLGYRQMAWRVFDFGGSGEGFWAFGDLSGAPTSWNEYNAAKPTYAPAFLGENTVHNSIHWDAVREGVEDFEELAMLRDAIQKSKNAALKTQAQKVLDEAVKTVINNQGDNTEYSWPKATNPLTVDAQLAKVRAMLKKLNS